jgi:hypothetical protein
MASLISEETRVLLLSSVYGVSRGLAGFPIEQPLESVKTQWQANPAIKNEIQITKKIYTQKGIQGFYAGSLPNIARVVLKNLYRFPLMVNTPWLIEKYVPVAAKDRRLSKGLTGVTISAFEAAILCPVERIKTFMMTRESKLQTVL